MKFQFHFKQLDVSAALKEYTESQFLNLTSYLLKDSHWHVFYSHAGVDYAVEVVVTNPEGSFKVKAKSDDSLYLAVDRAAEKLSKQFLKFKERMQDHSKFERSKQGKLARVNAQMEFDGRPIRPKKTA